LKRVLITGATGFVGSNLCRRLLNEGHEVFCLLRPEHEPWRIEGIRADVRIHTVDLMDQVRLSTLVSEVRPEWIFHLAAYGAYSWQADLDRLIRTNLLSTINLMQACLETGFEIFINTGSSSEYGLKDHAPAPTESIDPNSYYAVTKASATLFCRYTASRFHLPVPTLRLYSVYGPFEEPGRFIPTLIVRGLEGSLPPLVDPLVARDYVYVRDVEDAYVRLASQPLGTNGDIFNVGTGTQTTIAEVVELARRVLGLSAAPEWGSMPRREWDTSIWRADNRTLVARGWQPHVNLETGFGETIRWFQEHPELMEHYVTA
jgi:nucleoside-diphosphate-sugar epimerase